LRQTACQWPSQQLVGRTNAVVAALDDLGGGGAPSRAIFPCSAAHSSPCCCSCWQSTSSTRPATQLLLSDTTGQHSTVKTALPAAASTTYNHANQVQRNPNQVQRNPNQVQSNPNQVQRNPNQVQSNRALISRSILPYCSRNPPSEHTFTKNSHTSSYWVMLLLLPLPPPCSAPLHPLPVCPFSDSDSAAAAHTLSP